VKGRDLFLLVALAAIWSASFLFIKIALVETTPTFIVLARLVFGSLTLLASIPLLRNRVPELLPNTEDGRGMTKNLTSLRWPLLFLGAVNAVVPYTAIAWGERFIASGTASIFNSTVPLFTALLVLALPLFPEERPNLLGLAGLALGPAARKVRHRDDEAALLCGLQDDIELTLCSHARQDTVASAAGRTGTGSCSSAAWWLGKRVSSFRSDHRHDNRARVRKARPFELRTAA
jgi:hypothetical protein